MGHFSGKGKKTFLLSGGCGSQFYLVEMDAGKWLGRSGSLPGNEAWLEVWSMIETVAWGVPWGGPGDGGGTRGDLCVSRYL